jgi:hypothetical protein
MKSNAFIALLIFSLLHIEMIAQENSTSTIDMKDLQDYIYREDLLIRNTHYILTCKEMETKGIAGYRFELEKDTMKRWFKMINIKSGEKSIAIFKTELLSAIKKLNLGNLDLIFKRDSAKLSQIMDNVSKKKKRLSSEERLFLQDLIENAYQYYEYYGPEPLIIGELDLLKNKLDSTGKTEDSKWIDTVRVVNMNKAKEIPNQVNALAPEVLSDINLKITFGSDTDMETGILYTYSKAKLYLCNELPSDSINNKKIIEDSINIEKVDIKFENEQIADIKVIGNFIKGKNGKSYTNGKSEGFRMVFQNRIPIPYSTKADVSNDKNNCRLRKIRLYETIRRDTFYINIKDVIYNDYKLLNQTENYSPIDQVITLKPHERGKVIKKETVSKLLDAAIYTDLVGFNGSKPNGLIQTEISRRFYINRRVCTISPTYLHFGFFNDIKPKITLSKLESNNKVLELSSKPVNSNSVQLYTNAIDIFKHTSWSSGGELNLVTAGLPGIQSMMYIDAGAFIHNVPMRLPKMDSTVYLHDIKADEDRLFNKGFLAFYPKINWTISPHSRFQIAYSVIYYWLKNFSKDFMLVSNEQEFLTGISNRHNWATFLSLKFLATMRLPNKTNTQLFFRSYYNYLLRNPSQNYFQAQIGYAFNIFERKEPPPLKPFEGL